MDRSVRDELIALAHEWDRSMVENDADSIGRYMSDDWVIIGPDGSIGDKAILDRPSGERSKPRTMPSCTWMAIVSVGSGRAHAASTLPSRADTMAPRNQDTCMIFTSVPSGGCPRLAPDRSHVRSPADQSAIPEAA
jgi:hypothetical protein